MPSKTRVRFICALLAASAGVLNIVSALYPELPDRMDILRDFVPMHLIRASSTATVLVGFCLILLADGLRKRRRAAMRLTLVLLLLSSILHLSKGLDFEESLVDCLFGFALLRGRSEFDIRSRLPVPGHAATRLAGLGILYYCYVIGGFLVLRHAILPAPTLWTASIEPFRLAIDASQFHYLTPHARWFGRSIVLFASLGGLYAILQLLRPLIPVRVATAHDIHRARSLVQTYGSDSLSYFALQDGRSYFFDESGEAFLSYRLWGNVALVGGDPIGRPDRIRPVIEAFLESARVDGLDPCFLGVGGAHSAIYRSAGMHLLKIGEEAVIDLASFDVQSLKRKVRRAARHAAELGVTTEAYSGTDLPDHLRTELEQVSRDWIGTKGGAEQGFSMTLGRLPRAGDEDCEVIVAFRDSQVLGYLSLVPAHDSGTWSLDAMRRLQDAPNGLTEFMVISAAEMYRIRGFSHLSLNFATLSNAVDDIESRALDGTRRFLWEHLSTVYQLKSLYQFNSKFEPVWQSRYLAYRDVLKIPKLAIAIAQTEAPIQHAVPLPVLRREP